MSLSERMKIVRECLGLSQKDMAKTIDVSLAGVQVYEAGRSVPGGNVFMALVKRGFNANWLLTGEGAMKLNEYAGKQGYGGGETGVNVCVSQAQTPDLAPELLELVTLLKRYGNQALVENMRQRLLKIKQETEG